MTRFDEIILDQLIKMDAVMQLAKGSYISTSNIKVNVSNGTVTLKGEVPTDFARTSAENDVRNVRGVTGVKNLILVRHRLTDAG